MESPWRRNEYSNVIVQLYITSIVLVKQNIFVPRVSGERKSSSLRSCSNISTNEITQNHLFEEQIPTSCVRITIILIETSYSQK